MKKLFSVLVSLLLALSICVLSVPVYSLTNSEMDKMQKTANFVAFYNHGAGYEFTNAAVYGYIEENYPEYITSDDIFTPVWLTKDEYIRFYYAACPEAPKGFVENSIIETCLYAGNYDASADKYGIMCYITDFYDVYEYKSRTDNKDGTATFYYIDVDFNPDGNIKKSTGFEIKLRKNKDGITFIHEKKVNYAEKSSSSSKQSPPPSISSYPSDAKALADIYSALDSHSLSSASDTSGSSEIIDEESNAPLD